MTALAERGIRGVFGSSNDRAVRRVGFIRHRDGRSQIIPGSILDRINQLEPDYEKLTEGELKQTTAKLRAKLADGKTLDDILPEAFAAVRESSKRYLKMRHYDVQMVGGYTLHQVEDRRDGDGGREDLGLYSAGVSECFVGQGPRHHGQRLPRQARYGVGRPDAHRAGAEGRSDSIANAAVGSSAALRVRHHVRNGNEFGFDYLRDNMKPRRDMQCRGGSTSRSLTKWTTS